MSKEAYHMAKETLCTDKRERLCAGIPERGAVHAHALAATLSVWVQQLHSPLAARRAHNLRAVRGGDPPPSDARLRPCVHAAILHAHADTLSFPHTHSHTHRDSHTHVPVRTCGSGADDTSWRTPVRTRAFGIFVPLGRAASPSAAQRYLLPRRSN